MAAEAYSEAIKSGLDHIQAAEIANETLFKGLHFSPYNVIVEILWNEFSDEVSPGEAQTKAKDLLPECQAVFAKYSLNDDYAETTEYQSLYTELVGTILILLENELQ
jgi:tRNA G37 N-methylase Trm5